MNSWIFEFLVLMTVIAHNIIITMTFSQNFASNSIDDSYPYFLGFYTIEMFIKISALGYIFPLGSYMRDFWNTLDFSLIFSSHLSYIVNSNQAVIILKYFRILVALKIISKYLEQQHE